MEETMETLQDIQEETQEVIQEAPVEESPQPQQAAEPTQEEKNFAALRNKAELAERERDAYHKRLQELEAVQQNQQQQQQPTQEEWNVNDDDLVEGKHIKAVKKDVEAQRKQMEAQRKQMEAMITESRLKAQYHDFDAVVNNDNIARLRTAYPEIAATLGSSEDVYNTAASVYTLIKKFGIYDGQNTEAQKQVVQENATKPRPLTSVSPQQGNSPLTQANAFANGLTKDLKAQLYKEMIEYSR